MLDGSASTSLPQRKWIAKFNPETLEAYLGDSEHSDQLRRTHTVWSDDFDNIIEPTPSNDEQASWSRKQICRKRGDMSLSSHREHPLMSSSSLLYGDRPSHRLYADDCFVDGLVEGIGFTIVGVIFLGIVASVFWLLSVRLGLLRSRGRRRRSSISMRLPAIEEESDVKSEIVLHVEKV